VCVFCYFVCVIILCFLCINCMYNYKKNPDICLLLFSTITNRDTWSTLVPVTFLSLTYNWKRWQLRGIATWRLTILPSTKMDLWPSGDAAYKLLLWIQFREFSPWGCTCKLPPPHHLYRIRRSALIRLHFLRRQTTQEHSHEQASLRSWSYKYRVISKPSRRTSFGRYSSYVK